MSRRIWLWSSGLVVCATLALGLWAVWLEPAGLTIVEERVSLDWPAHAPLRIAILTDLHIGSPFNGIAKLRDTVDRTNAARPDLICILGDLVIQGVLGGRFVTPEAIATELKRLHAPSGVVAVLGNHDGWLDHDRVRDALQRNGIRVVEDRAERLHTPAGAVWVAGISDLWTGQHDLAAALATVENDGAPLLLLTHNPDVFPLVPNRVSLTLAGHTHGGQVQLPFVGRPIVPSRFGQRFAAGHVVEGGRHMYVATGLGTSILPVRFRVPPAVTVLTLIADQPVRTAADNQEALPRTRLALYPMIRYVETHRRPQRSLEKNNESKQGGTVGDIQPEELSKCFGDDPGLSATKKNHLAATRICEADRILGSGYRIICAYERAGDARNACGWENLRKGPEPNQAFVPRTVGHATDLRQKTGEIIRATNVELRLKSEDIVDRGRSHGSNSFLCPPAFNLSQKSFGSLNGAWTSPQFCSSRYAA